MPSSHLFRDHTRIALTGIVLHLLAALPAYYVILAPQSDLSRFLIPFIPAVLVTGIAEWIARVVVYRPLRTLDGLSSDERYAQNDDLCRGVVLLYNLPLFSAFRVCVGRGLLFPLAYIAFGMLFTGMTFSGPWEMATFMLMALTMVPVLPAAYEFFRLPPLIEKHYVEMMSYHGILPVGWQQRILIVASSTRIVYLVAMVGVAPALLLLSHGLALRPADAAMLWMCILGIAVVFSLLMRQSMQRSVDILLSAMHQIGRNRSGPPVSITTADEFAVLAGGMTTMISGLKEQSFIRDTFGKHVPRAIVEAVLREGVNLQGEKRQVATLLVDIRDFRARFDQASPTDIISVLNQYLATVIDAAQHFGGTIDKVVGDRVLVAFGAPVTLDQPVERALFAALAIRKGMVKLNRKLTQSSTPPMLIAMSIHHGDAIAGHIGAAERWEYSIVGDVVGETYRLNEVQRTVTDDILVSDQARRSVDASFTFGPVLPAVLQTKRNNAVRVFPLVDHQYTSQPPDAAPVIA